MKISIISLLIAMTLTTSGCTRNIGSYGINSHFSYPNSNVTPIGQVKATTSKISFFISPSFDGSEIIELTQEAIAQQQGADILLNYTLDTKITTFILVTKMVVTIDGTAAKMNVGSQNLMNFYEKVQYKAK